MKRWLAGLFLFIPIAAALGQAPKIETAVRFSIRQPDAVFVVGTQLGPEQDFLHARLWVSAGSAIAAGRFSGSAAMLLTPPLALRGFRLEAGLGYTVSDESDWDALVQASLAVGQESALTLAPRRGGLWLGYERRW